MDLSIFRGSALNHSVLVYESVFMNTINIGNVETAVKSTWHSWSWGERTLW